MTIPSRLFWACRRGMLELDLLLGNFLKEVFLDLSPACQTTFVQLLYCSDQDLYHWFIGKELPTKLEFKTLIQQIKHHAESRSYT